MLNSAVHFFLKALLQKELLEFFPLPNGQGIGNMNNLFFQKDDGLP